MQVRAVHETEVLRPSRLNMAGWCAYCTERYCDSAECIRRHAVAVWEVCSDCGGCEYTDIETLERCPNCVSGVMQVLPGRPVLAAVPDVRRSEVVYESWPAGGGAPTRWTAR